MPENHRLPFYLFVDEFQNFASPAFETILCEARKFRLGLVIALQSIGSLSPELRNTALNNSAVKIL
ncbi:MULTISPECIES: TraM recognition domain-containing protein [unclassified Chryseobacterium]|uniref:TraM recognition domain-containing protein n=1 Tax=unclassified Chryseobacterium TaxID=2593645 RepID=UPI0013FDAD76|nr:MULTISPECIES: TraM recognition domain-containing protein [unclassified Chryseobacterium]